MITDDRAVSSIFLGLATIFLDGKLREVAHALFFMAVSKVLRWLPDSTPGVDAAIDEIPLWSRKRTAPRDFSGLPGSASRLSTRHSQPRRRAWPEFLQVGSVELKQAFDSR